MEHVPALSPHGKHRAALRISIGDDKGAPMRNAIIATPTCTSNTHPTTVPRTSKSIR